MTTIIWHGLADAPPWSYVVSLALGLVVLVGLALLVVERQNRPATPAIVAGPPVETLTAAHLRRLSHLTSLALVLAGLALFGSAVLVGLRTTDSHSEVVATPTQTDPTLVVVGRGSAPLVPDTAAIVIGVEGTWPTVEEAARRIDAAVEAAAAAGVLPDDARTIAYRVTPVQATGADGLPTVMQGIQVSQRVGLTVRDLARLDAVLTAVTSAGVTVYGVGLGTGDPGAAIATARNTAMADARAKADQIAAELGVTIRHAEQTIELDATSPPPAPLALAVADPAAPPPSATAEVKVEIQVTYSVRVGEAPTEPPGASLGFGAAPALHSFPHR